MSTTIPAAYHWHDTMIQVHGVSLARAALTGSGSTVTARARARFRVRVKVRVRVRVTT